jgi:hypothetical protein
MCNSAALRGRIEQQLHKDEKPLGKKLPVKIAILAAGSRNWEPGIGVARL